MFGKRQSPDVVRLDAHRQRQDLKQDKASDAQKSKFPLDTAQPDTEETFRPEIVEQTAIETSELAEVILRGDELQSLSRRELAERVGESINADLVPGGLNPRERRDVITQTINRLLEADQPQVKLTEKENLVEQSKAIIQPILMDRIDVTEAGEMPRQELAQEVADIVGEILNEHKIQLNLLEQREIVTLLLNDMLGFGPLEVLLADEAVTDIMVNGADQVYVERGGKLTLSEVRFRDNRHVMQIASRIVSGVGRRVDESSPLCDARLPDGSRVNIIIPPLAIDGPTISIRKFSKKKITLDVMQRQENISPEMATVLKIASRSRLNILVSGGTGSGKTTLLNALSRMIDSGERIVTIEDAAELQLQQPHVVRLETRPPNLEGEGEITQRELVKNALRMRPDRIILGEIRAGEALDMLQAMNTGHDGSLGTIHANRPREALTRLENMVAMAGVKLPNEAVRAQIAGAVDLVVQISRMRDGKRRITHITEVVGMEGEVVTTQNLFTFQFEGEDKEGNLFGAFKSTGLRPAFSDRAKYFGLDKALMEAMG